jgi:NADH-quinone oxidoreductase subunit L
MYALAASASSLLLATAEEGGHAPEFSDGGALAAYAWLIPVVPMVMAFAIVFFGRKSPLKGWGMAEAAMGFVALYGIVLFVMNVNDPILYQGSIHVADIGINIFGEPLVVEWGWMVDGLSTMMYFVVGVVGLLVFTYAKSYMDGDIRYTWFFASFTLFAGGMLVLVSAPNLIQLIVGWELVGVASYLLIGHYWEDHENSSAAIKAFLVNKTADVGLFVGVIIVAVTVGSFRFTDVMDTIAQGAPSPLAKFAFWAGLALFIGAMGKSAQFPFHVWLPDAMAGPTPVSALMHAATMVTAGVFLIARMFPLYVMPDFAVDVRSFMIVVGAITLLFVGLIALVQNDIKKVLAYSTVSQLGYMVVALGAGAYTAATFHLFTHAFFKALLFLGAGSVIHAVHSNEMTDMGGLRKFMPRTFWTWIIGSLALIGLFPFAGFFSKDEILASLRYAANESGASAVQGGEWVANLVFWAAVLGAFVTAFYMARATFLTFYGKYKGDQDPHESPAMMTWPLIGLAVGAMFAGFLNWPGLTAYFTDVVGIRFFEAFHDLEHHAESFDYVAMIAGLAMAGLGVFLGYLAFYPDADTQEARDRVNVPILYPLLRHKYYIDDFYMDGIVRPTRGPVARAVDWFNGHVIDFVVNGAGLAMKWSARYVYLFDQRGIDGAINASGAATNAFGGVLRVIQTGKVQQYATMMLAGTLIIVAGFIIF